MASRAHSANRSIWISCIAVPPGKEITYLQQFYQRFNIQLEDIEIYPKRTACLTFSTQSDCERCTRGNLPPKTGMITAIYPGKGMQPKVADSPCPHSLWYTLYRDKYTTEDLEYKYHTICIMSKTCGTLLRGPSEKINKAIQFLQKRYPNISWHSSRYDSGVTKHSGIPGVHRERRFKMPAAGSSEERPIAVVGQGYGFKKDRPDGKESSKHVPVQESKEMDAFVQEEVMLYIYKVRKEDIKMIEKTYGVKLVTVGAGKLVIRPNTKESARYLERAFGEFVTLYQQIYYSLAFREVDLQDSPLSYKELCQRLDNIQERFPRMVILYGDERPFVRSVKLCGSAANVEKVVQLLLYTTHHAAKPSADTEELQHLIRPKEPTSRAKEDETSTHKKTHSTTQQLHLTTTSSRADDPMHDTGAHAADVVMTGYAKGALVADVMTGYAKGAHVSDDRNSALAKTRNKDRKMTAEADPTTGAMGDIRHRRQQPDPHVVDRVDGIVTYKNSTIQVEVYQGNIVEEQVDAIVNAVDVHLQHHSGVARAISSAAGHQLQDICNNYLRSHGTLQYGQVVASPGFNLPAGRILHAAGPHGGLPDAVDLLKQTCYNILKKADRLGLMSIAVPAISTGHLGMSKEQYSQAMIEALVKFIDQCPVSTLHTVKLVDIDPLTSIILRAEADDILLKSGFRRKLQKLPATSHSQPSVRSQFATKGNSKQNPRGTVYDGEIVLPMHTPVDDSGKPDSRRAAVHSVAPSSAMRSVRGTGTQERKARPESHSTRAATGSEPTGLRSSPEHDTSTCPICLCEITEEKLLPRCRHKFCKDCIDEALESRARCPVCNDVLELREGDQPEGTMTDHLLDLSLPGYPHTHTIMIKYDFPDGVQTAEHPNPGQPYTGTKRVAFLPDTSEGQEVLRLLKKAFQYRLLFTIGTSITTGRSNIVVWNDVHQKTSMSGGPECFGYPDETYLSRVKEELAAKGIK